MGIVHLAEHASMGRGVAVKTLKEGHRDPASPFTSRTITASSTVITVEPRMWPSAVVYLIALFLALRFTNVVFLILSASHFALTVNAVSVRRNMFSGFRPD